MDQANCIFCCVFFLLCLTSQISDCFKWTRNHQSSKVINSALGSDVTLSCDYLLSAEEEQAMQQFHLVYWTREFPKESQNWQGLAARTNLIGNSLPRIIYHDKSRILMKKDSLTILNVKPEDATQYQCEVKSSFYTTPSVFKLQISASPGVKNQNEQSAISSGASAGIGVGATLITIGVIAAVGILWMAKRNRGRAVQEPTNLERMSSARNDAAEAHVGPGYDGNEMNVRSENLYCSVQDLNKTETSSTSI